MDYLELCENVFERWLSGKISYSVRLTRLFTLEHAPEPYLIFGGEEPGCVFVTTNPGQGFTYQLRATPGPGGALLNFRSYRDAARKMGDFYSAPGAPIAAAARTNIASMRRIAALFGAPSLMQAEAIPWHSPSLPRKELLGELRRTEPIYEKYHRLLASFLSEQRVVLSYTAGDPESRGGAGVQFKAELIGLNLATAQRLVLERTDKVSQALFWSRDDRGLRGLFVNQGSATLPRSGANRAGENKDLLLARIALAVDNA